MSQTDKAIRGAVVVLLYATLLVPFLVADSMLFPYITGKGFAFRLIVEAALALWVVLAIRCPEYRPRWKSPTLVAGAIFLAVVAAADFLAVDPQLAIWSKFERMDGLVLVLHVGAYALVLSSVFQTAADWRRFLSAQVIAAVAMSVYAATQILGYQNISQGDTRVDGRFGNAVYLAGYMLFSVGFAVFLSLREEDRRVRAAYLALAAIFAVVLAYTGTRGSLLGLVAGAGVAGALLLTFGRDNRYRKIGAWSVGALALAVALFAVGREVDWVKAHPVFGRIANTTLQDKTVLSRVWNAEIAWKGFLERPVLGWGQGNYGMVFDKNYDLRMHDQEQYFDRTHSILTDWLVAGGALGFLAYFALLIAVAYGIWRAEGLRGDERAALLALLAAYLVHNVFVFDNVASYMHYAALAGLAIALAPAAESRRRQLGADAGALLAAAAIVALPIVAYAVNAAPMRAARGVIDGMTTGDATRFEEALAENSFGSPEVAVQYSYFSQRAAATPDVPDETKVALVSAADSALADAVAAHPSDSYLRAILGAFRLQTQGAAAATAELEQAVLLAPNKQSVRATLAMAYAWADDPRALDYARETYEIQPANDLAWRAYARVAVKLGRNDVFSALIAEAQATGRHDRVVGLAADRVAMNPQDPQARASLARALSDAARYDEAIEVLVRAAVDFPAGKAQYDAFRAQIEAARDAAVDTAY